MRKLLVISLAANVVLIALAVFAFQQRNIPAAVETAQVEKEKPGPELTRNTPAPIEPTESLPKSSAERVIQSWQDIESTDFQEYMDNLKRIGCSDETIADIIISEVSEMFRGRLAALPAVPRREYKFWQTGPTQLYPRLDPALEKARREIETERDELLRTLLGDNYATYKVPRGAAEKWMNDQFFAALPAEKRNRLFDANDRYDSAVRAIRDHRQNYLDADDAKELDRLRRQRDSEIAAVLAPEELEQFQTRLSDDSENVRKTILSTFDASEAEFRAMVSAEVKRRENGDAAAIENDLKQALGESRYNDYKLSSDYDYRRLAQLTDKQKLPREMARTIFEMKPKIEQQVRAIQMDPSIPVQERMQRMSDLRARTLDEISSLLGEEAFNQFYQNAWWLRNIPSTSPNVRPAATVINK